jgi:hypothetical protein
MPWNDEKNQGRYEIIFRPRDKALHDELERRASLLRMSVPKYLVYLAICEIGDVKKKEQVQ